ncbi:hypothetical protein BP5796_11743 [Coleophoma crateriformis]|uniref:Sm domain-containing protein n=1 Tax=Coleophoma crateriformis TaxID=565419 RepID=A0A3D8QEH7_9HELO|nr:hypothetical protein BP5796_11743 [Coleophoma crateriformis]
MGVLLGQYLKGLAMRVREATDIASITCRGAQLHLRGKLSLSDASEVRPPTLDRRRNFLLPSPATCLHIDCMFEVTGCMRLEISELFASRVVEVTDLANHESAVHGSSRPRSSLRVASGSINSLRFDYSLSSQTLTPAPSRPPSSPKIKMLFFSFFKTLVDHEVTVELKNDIQIRGTLKSVDQYLNIKLDDISVVEELKYPHLNLQSSVKNVFIRGSVVRYVHLPGGAVDTALLEDATRREAAQQATKGK